MNVGQVFEDIESGCLTEVTRAANQFYNNERGLIEKADAIPGIKVDSGTTNLAAHPGELITQGLDGLRERLRTRLISEAQRQLLDAMLPPPEGAGLDSGQAREELAAQGSVELF